MSDTLKSAVDATNSEVDIVKLLQAYGMVSIEGSELKHRRPKKVATDKISLVPIQTLSDVCLLNLHTSHWYYKEVLWNVALMMYNGSHVKIFHQ